MHVSPMSLDFLCMQLVIGKLGLSVDQQRSQMALWAIFAAVRASELKFLLSKIYFLPSLIASSHGQQLGIFTSRV